MRKKSFDTELKSEEFRVTVFGSSRIKKEDPIYRQIFSLAKMLGERDIDVVTGGGPGIMEAANSGHQAGSKKTHANSIGLNIKLTHEQTLNKSVDVSKTFTRFSERLDNFMLLSDTVVVASGGVGTLLELFYTWQLVQVKHICSIPIILLGGIWPDLLKWLKDKPLQRGFFDREDLDKLFWARNANHAVKMIDAARAAYDKGDENFCLNIKKYAKG